MDRRQWHVANNVIDFAETVRIGGPRLLAGARHWCAEQKVCARRSAAGLS
jgi:hypothetical protein